MYTVGAGYVDVWIWEQAIGKGRLTRVGWWRWTGEGEGKGESESEAR
jgi:hypothetical protein